LPPRPIWAQNKKSTGQQSLAVDLNEVTAFKLLYPSQFLTPEDMFAQHIAQQHIPACMAVKVLIHFNVHHEAALGKLNRHFLASGAVWALFWSKRGGWGVFCGKWLLCD